MPSIFSGDLALVGLILQMGLGVFDFTVYAFQGGLQLRGITADFYGDAFNAACCQCGHLQIKHTADVLARSQNIG